MRRICYPILSVCILVLLAACGHSGKQGRHLQGFPYDLSKPDEVIRLPKDLMEVSGQFYRNDTAIWMISDGNGDVYDYSVKGHKVRHKIKLVRDRDFEDVCQAGNKLFVLQSNGGLWIVENPLDSNGAVLDSLPIKPPFELEGICSSADGDSLFIAAKYWHKGPLDKGELPVWLYLNKNDSLIHQPLFHIPSDLVFKKQHFIFHSSGICRLPGQDGFAIVSTDDKGLLIVSGTGEVRDFMHLDPSIYPQPEGIAISPNGDLSISSEGRGDRGLLMIFHKKQI